MKKVVLGFVTLFTLPCLGESSFNPKIFSLEVHVNQREPHTNTKKECVITQLADGKIIMKSPTKEYEEGDWNIRVNCTGIKYDSDQAAKDLPLIKFFNQSSAERLKNAQQDQLNLQQMIKQVERFIDSVDKKEKKRKQ